MSQKTVSRDAPRGSLPGAHIVEDNPQIPYIRSPKEMKEKSRVRKFS
jgi:hypothetical protein